MPKVPPAASEPKEAATGYLRAVSAGKATVPTVAAVATEEPEVAANRAQVPILVCSKPPGRRPSQTDSASNMRSAMPPRSSNSPSSMNKGTAVITELLSVLQTTPPIMSISGMPWAKRPPTVPTNKMAKATGRLRNIRASMTAKPMAR
jgi:hypothetical protein